jgi:hypothetical protein
MFNSKCLKAPAVVVVLDIVHPDNGVLDAGLIVVGVRLGSHPEGVGLEAGLAEHRVKPATTTKTGQAEFFSFLAGPKTIFIYRDLDLTLKVGKLKF